MLALVGPVRAARGGRERELQQVGSRRRLAVLMVASGLLIGACGSSDDTTVPDLAAPVSTAPDPNALVVVGQTSQQKPAGQQAAGAPANIGVAANAESATAFCDGLKAFRVQEQAALRITKDQLPALLNVARANLAVISMSAPADVGVRISPYVDAWRSFLDRAEKGDKSGAPVPIYDKAAAVAKARTEWNSALQGC